MFSRFGCCVGARWLFAALGMAAMAGGLSTASWRGSLRDDAGKPVNEATIQLRATAGGRDYTARTAATGHFAFPNIAEGNYRVSVERDEAIFRLPNTLVVRAGTTLTATLHLSTARNELRIDSSTQDSPQASGGEHLSSGEASGLPLNAHEFSNLHLLAAATTTDVHGTSNFTPQFADNGTRRPV